MPLFEFRCRACSAVFERHVGQNASTDNVDCKECGKAEAEKLFSTFASPGVIGPPAEHTHKPGQVNCPSCSKH